MSTDANIPVAGLPDPRRREPLWDRVDRNKLRLAGFVAVFVCTAVLTFDLMLALTVGCVSVGLLARATTVYSSTAPFSTRTVIAVMAWVSVSGAAVTLTWALYTLSRSEKWLLRAMGATLVPKGEMLPTKMALKDMAIAAGFKVAPALYAIDSTNVNAFVFAARRRRAVVGVTLGLVSRLTVDEQRAVFANLVARLVSGDTIVDTGVVALLWPIQAWRERVTMQQNDAMDSEMSGRAFVEDSAQMLPALFFFGVALAILTEVFAGWRRVKQRRAAEKADAEGMLLLKSPPAMLAALEKSVRFNNVIPRTGELFADLFFCWPGDSTDDEDDPEWGRVARLREVLGVEGCNVGNGQLSGIESASALNSRAPRLDRDSAAD